MTSPVDFSSPEGPSAPAAGAPGAVSLRFSGVSMTFPDGTRALDDVSFEVRRGEFATIVGPSGCGKSTVLRLASGLLTGSTGCMELTDSNIGYVFQDATLLPWRSVRRNVELFCELRGMDKRERSRRAADAVELVGLRGFENSYPRRLSGGMRMRTSLARSLTLNPKLFLFDEPFGALDEITRERLNDELQRLFMLERFAALFITHSIQEAVFLSTRVLVMSDRPGHIVAEVEVPFAYPRDPDIRFDRRFGELAAAVSHALRGGHA